MTVNVFTKMTFAWKLNLTINNFALKEMHEKLSFHGYNPRKKCSRNLNLLTKICIYECIVIKSRWLKHLYRMCAYWLIRFARKMPEHTPLWVISWVCSQDLNYVFFWSLFAYSFLKFLIFKVLNCMYMFWRMTESVSALTCVPRVLNFRIQLFFF